MGLAEDERVEDAGLDHDDEPLPAPAKQAREDRGRSMIIKNTAAAARRDVGVQHRPSGDPDVLAKQPARPLI